MQVEVQIDTSKPGPMKDMYEDDQFQFLPSDMFKNKKDKKSVHQSEDHSKKSKQSSSMSLKQLQSDMLMDEGTVPVQRRPSEKATLSRYRSEKIEQS